MKHLILIGFMASGKSTLAKALSASLNLPLFSTDIWIEQRTQMSIDQIFSSYGEDEFRIWEKRAYEYILNLEHRSIVDCGGGFVLQGELEKLGRVYFLDTPLEIIKTRLLQDQGDKRPLKKKYQELYTQRRMLYKNESSLIIRGEDEVLEDWRRINALLP